MRFEVIPVGGGPRKGIRSRAVLYADSWNDWWEYQTQFYLSIFDDQGAEHDIGQVKIGEMGMVLQPQGSVAPSIPDKFDRLAEEFFSVGQDVSYYDNLNKLGEQVRDEALRALRDIAHDAEILESTFRERVMSRSLLRSVDLATVEGQFRRIAKGGARLTEFHASYNTAPPRKNSVGVELTFDVEPESQPPTNIHVLIGRNGVGKTRILNHMTRVIADNSSKEEEVGSFAVDSPSSTNSSVSDSQGFTSLVSVTFSAFDPFEPLSRRSRGKAEIKYTYIGLKKVPQGTDSPSAGPKDPSALAREFANSVRICIQGARLGRWRRALQILESDPIFADAQIAGIADAEAEDDDLKALAQETYRNLSSGHKIVLLTVTRLVETVAERSLVLLDEPEAHLHPPLLSAFVRALSDLLINRNGVAIIATHSPVVLQEVPKSCVWVLRRSGRTLKAERPSIETFGENVGILTRAVFGLEVTRSGFHRQLEEAVESSPDYDAVVAQFNGRLGAEARAIIQGLLASREA
ncbi:hypothetical protein Asp14428_33380 [Actinoplanes sp. NBRC 14428]|nr:hypothetical protein Asp14428_33380 [Actinoplanes sp. NBRC 14428]